MSDSTNQPPESSSNVVDLSHIAADLRHLAVGIDSLTPDPANARSHSPKNIDVIKGSLKRFGQVKPIVVDAKSIIVAGNGTYAAAKALGWTHIACVRSGLDGVNAAAFGIVDNRSAELADWDNDALARHLLAIRDDASIDAMVTGFDPDQIEALIAEATGRGTIPAGAEGTEYTESVANDVQTCPHCGGVL